MLAVVFEEFKVFHIFLLLFFLFNSLSFSIDKRSTLAKIWGGGRATARPSPRFLRACLNTNIYRAVQNAPS